jgi:hypothetical protein
MTLGDVDDICGYSTGKTSDIARQAGLAGIALVWLFKREAPPVIPPALVLPLGCIFVGLLLDFLQYAVTGILWGRFRDRMETEHGQEGDFLAPWYMSRATWTFFYVKLVPTILAYMLLLRFLWNALLLAGKP